MPDITVTGALHDLAAKLEAKAGTDPGALARDTEIVARIRRITDAIDGGALVSHDIPDHNDAQAASPADGDFFRYDSALLAWKNATAALADLSDVASTAPSSGQALVYDGAEWAPGAGGAESLDDLTDVTISSPANLQVLQHDGSGWVNSYYSMNELSDVSAAAPGTDYILRHDGSQWIAVTGNIYRLTDVATGGAITDDFMIFDGSNWVNTPGSLDMLPGVTITGSTSGTILYDSGGPNGYENVTSATWAAGISAFAFAELAQSRLGGAAADQVIAYDSGGGTWDNFELNELDPLGNWDMGANEITAKKWLSENTTPNTTFDNVDIGINFTTTATDINTYNGLLVDVDYDLASGHLGIAKIRGAYVDIVADGAGTYVVNSINAYAGILSAHGETAPAIFTGGVSGLNLSVKGNSASNPVFGAYTQGIQANASNIGYGYQGYGQNTAVSGSNLQAVGVYGYAQASSGIMVGVRGEPFTPGTSGFAFYGQNGHVHINNGVTYLYASTAIQTAATTTHITPVTNDGSLYIEALLEVDGTAFFDGDVTMAATQMLTIGVYADGSRPAAGTAGRVIFNTTDGNLNIDDGTNWILPDGTTT